MTLPIGSAAAAYAKTRAVGDLSVMDARDRDPAKNFSDVLSQAIEGAIETGHQGEAMSAKGVAGQADLKDVVQAVNNAEVTLQTALAIRDRVVQAYQEVLRMPI